MRKKYLILRILDKTSMHRGNRRLELIFESFFTSGKKDGTGLGLPFCRRIMRAFDGDIICKSKVKKGTEF